MERIQLISPADLRPNPRNARRHSKKQIRQIADRIVAYGFTVPVLVDEKTCCLRAWQTRGGKATRSQTVPVIKLVVN
jgi:ParB-like chromosome segregation protein Spo0J